MPPVTTTVWRAWPRRRSSATSGLSSRRSRGLPIACRISGRTSPGALSAEIRRRPEKRDGGRPAMSSSEPRSGALRGHYPSGQFAPGALRFVKTGTRTAMRGHTLATAVLIEERSAALRVSPQAPSGTALRGARTRWYARGGTLLVAGCVALAALTLLLPSAPTYDPWAWIIWGREVAHLDLVTTNGPSWKPLPVMFTTVFSFFGGAAPDLWLVVARAGAIAAGVLAFPVGGTPRGGLVGGVAAGRGPAVAAGGVPPAPPGDKGGPVRGVVLGG